MAGSSGWHFCFLVAVACSTSSTSKEIAVTDSAKPVVTLQTPTATSTPDVGCTPINVTPTYNRSATDSAAFESLIQGARVAGLGSSLIGVAGGDLCGGSELELAMLQPAGLASFSIARGPAPYVITQGTPVASTNWKGVAVGRLSPFDSYDKIVAVRSKTDNTSDLAIITADPTTCALSSQSEINLGGTTNAFWIGAAVGHFDGGAAKIVALRNAVSNNVVVLMENGAALRATSMATLDSNTSDQWTGVAAGDLDGDGNDELVTVRRGTSGQNIFVYRWHINAFYKIASTAYYAGATDPIVAVTIGDFNGDGRKSIAVVRNGAPNFALFTLHGTTLSLLSEAPLDSATASGQNWRGLAAVDLVSGFDQGAQELIAVRSVSPPYRVDTFVYGTSGNRSRRDDLLSNTRSQAYWIRPGASQEVDDMGQPNIDHAHDHWTQEDYDQLITAMQLSHTNTYNWLLIDPHDYSGLLGFLYRLSFLDSRDCVDGQQIRVWVTLRVPPGSDDTGYAYYHDPCSRPEASDITPVDEAAFFHEGIGSDADPEYCGQYIDASGGWSGLLGAVANQFPNLVAVGFDDFSGLIAKEDGTSDVGKFGEQFVSEFESRFQEQAPWVNFVPTFYFTDGSSKTWPQAIPDYGSLIDTTLFFFRNQLPDGAQGGCDTSTGCAVGPDTNCGAGGSPQSPALCGNACLTSTCAETSLPNAPSQFCTMKSFLEPGRKLQIGAYFTAHRCCGEPSARYDYSLFRMAINNPWMNIAGTTVYQAEMPQTGDPATECTDTNTLTDKFCTVARLYGGGDAVTVEDLDLTTASCFSPVLAAGRPFGYVVNALGNENIVYRGTDGKLYELWRYGARSGYTSLTASAGVGVTSLSDPTAFISPVDGSQHVDYRASDSDLHDMAFSTGAAVDRDVSTAIAGAAPIRPVGNVMGYGVSSLGENEILFRGTNNHIYEVYFSSSWPPSYSDLTLLSGTSAVAAGDPVGYSFDALSKQNAIVRSTDGHLREFYWWTGAVGTTDLTANSGAANSAGDPVAYVASSYGVQNVFYRGVDGHSHELYWSTGAVGASDLSGLGTGPVDDPWAYFRADDSTNHVVFRGSDNHIYSDQWTTGSVVQSDVTSKAENFPSTSSLPAGPPTAYFDSFDHTSHIIYRSADNHVHDLSWGK